MFGKIQLEGIDHLHKVGASIYDRALLLMLVGLAKYNGMVFNSQREIAEYAMSDVSNVNKAIKRLIAFGVLQRVDDALRIDPLFCQFGGVPCDKTRTP